MFNITLLSLNILSTASISPFYSINNCQSGIQTTFLNSHISRSFSNIIYSSMVNHKTLLINNVFSHSLASAINLNSDDINNCSLYPNYKYSPNTPIGGEIIYKEHSYFTGGCGNITITGCIFNESKSNTPGGAIFIEQNCFVIIHNTIFNYCSGVETGGACFIAQEKLSKPPNFNDIPIPQMDIQYCCFQNCYGNSNLYGIAIFSSATDSILYYASTVNCPGINGKMVAGAQFDLQATNVTSQYVNATGANSNYCGGIEYRYATEGFFRFQTISDMRCGFAVSYTDIKTQNLDLYESNIMNITLKEVKQGNDPLYPGLIHVRYTQNHKASDIFIEDFCFINNDFKAENAKIISKATLGGKICDYLVTLINCSYDCSDYYVEVEGKNHMKTINCHPDTKTLNDIEQLDLGDCKGKITAAPLTPSPSNEFTQSHPFSYLNSYTDSNSFTYNSEHPINDHSQNNDNQNQGNNNKLAIIAGASAAGAAAVAAAAVGTVFFLKRKPTKIEDINNVKENNNQTNNENPIYDQNAEDDPFQNDFHE